MTQGGWPSRCGPRGDAAAVAGVIQTPRGTLSTVSPARTALVQQRAEVGLADVGATR